MAEANTIACSHVEQANTTIEEKDVNKALASMDRAMETNNFILTEEIKELKEKMSDLQSENNQYAWRINELECLCKEYESDLKFIKQYMRRYDHVEDEVKSIKKRLWSSVKK